jgi:hypothetical protein
MKRLRAAWRAFLDPTPQVVVSPDLVRVHDIKVSREMATAIRTALLRLDRDQGRRP